VVQNPTQMKVKIANPAYDISFKFLMEDKEAASILLSDLIGQQIVDLEFKPKEYIINAILPDGTQKKLTTYRLDFKAVIQTEQGEKKVVLIEVQRAMFGTEQRRFRGYLGEQYASEENFLVIDDRDVGIPIIAIYFLGYYLPGVEQHGIIKVKREYRDGLTGDVIEARTDFIEALSHDLIVVQLRYFKEQPARSDLEKTMKLFDPSPNTLYLWVDETQFSEKYKSIIKRLKMAAVKPDITRRMQEEDYIMLAFKRKDDMIRREREARLKEREARLKEREARLAMARKTARELKKLGVPLERIQEITGLPITEILKL